MSQLSEGASGAFLLEAIPPAYSYLSMEHHCYVQCYTNRGNTARVLWNLQFSKL